MEASPRQLARALNESAKGADKGRLGGILGNFTKTLYKQGLLARAELVLEHLQAIRDREAARARVEVVSASPLDEASRQAVRSELAGRFGVREVELEESTDPGLLGGLVVRYDNRVIDLSVAGRLKGFERVMGE